MLAKKSREDVSCLAYYGKREWLIKLRKQNGLSQSLCAAMADISQSYLQKIEYGYVIPNQEIKQRITDVLGTEPSVFETEDKKMRR